MARFTAPPLVEPVPIIADVALVVVVCVNPNRSVVVIEVDNEGDKGDKGDVGCCWFWCWCWCWCWCCFCFCGDLAIDVKDMFCRRDADLCNATCCASLMRCCRRMSASCFFCWASSLACVCCTTNSCFFLCACSLACVCCTTNCICESLILLGNGLEGYKLF